MSKTFDLAEGPDGTFAYFEPTMGVAFSKRKSTETRTVRAADMSLGRRDYMPWGTDNLLPFQIFKEMEKSAQLDAIVTKLVRLLTSGGLMYGHQIIENNQRILIPVIHTEIEDWCQMIEADRFVEEEADGHYSLNNRFPEMTLDLGRRVTGIYSNDPSECRLGLQNREGRRKGLIDKVYVSADWRDRYSSENAEIIDAVDPYYDIVGQVRDGRAYKYIFPGRMQTRGRKYYQRSRIENLIESGWIDVAASIPTWKKQIMENQISIKYQVLVSEAYWQRKYPSYSQEPERKQKEIDKKEIDGFLNFFKKKQGAVHLSRYKQDHQGKEYRDWKIEAVGSDKVYGEGAYIEDDVQSSYVIARAMGLHPSLFGISPGGKGLGAGSGSDIRMASNAHILEQKPDQRKILRPFYYASALNGWNEKYGGEHKQLHWWFENYFIATLDHGKDTKKEEAA
jgi:hypothetical protein